MLTNIAGFRCGRRGFALECWLKRIIQSDATDVFIA
jgi:hypothetical protein